MSPIVPLKDDVIRVEELIQNARFIAFHAQLRDFTKRDHPISLKRDHRMRVFRSVSDGS